MAALWKPIFACALAIGLSLVASQEALAQRPATARRVRAPEPNPLRFAQAPPRTNGNNGNSADNLFSDEREPAPPPVPQRSGNDPTIPGPEIRQLLEAGNVAKPAGGPAGLPPIIIRARVLARDRTPAALVEVGGRIIPIRKGAEFQVPAGNGDTAGVTLRVTDVTVSEIRFEMNGRKQALILH